MNYPIYRKPNDWAILEERTIYDYSTNENPIEIVYVLIGTLHYDYKNFFGNVINKRTPITRWMTKKQYEGVLDEDF